jgi:hypothetical protein
MRNLAFILMLAVAAPAAGQWVPLFNGKSLDGWEVVGDGAWSVMDGGVILGDRVPGQSKHQSWLYTKRNDFREYDLSLEYWTRLGGNSGVSIRDHTRGQFAVGDAHDPKRTPSHNGYEIQISNGHRDKYPTGSVYLFAPAQGGNQKPGDWNRLEIESRDDLIRVKVNGVVVAEHPGDPARPKDGPIGLQSHDPQSIVMFRNIRIREIKGKR